MSEVHNIRKRIANRRFEQPKKKRRFFKVVYRFMMLMMGVAVLTLAYFINDKVGLVDLPAELTQINFGLVSEWLPFENWFSKDDQRVDAPVSYTLLKENEYTNGSNQANLLLDGVVLHVQQEGVHRGSVSVRHDNGVVATYGHLDQIAVHQDERLLKNSVLGTYSDYVTIDLVKNNQQIDLATALGSE